MNKAEIKSLLQDWLNGNLDRNDWDYFISVKIKEPALEAIRLDAQGIWVENSPCLKPSAIDPCQLTEFGRQEVKKLIQNCEEISG